MAEFGWYSERYHKSGQAAYWYNTPHGHKVLITHCTSSATVRPNGLGNDAVCVGLVKTDGHWNEAASPDTGKRRTRWNALI